MDETKDRLKQLIDLFTGRYLTSLTASLNVTNSAAAVPSSNSVPTTPTFEPDPVKVFIDDVITPNQTDDETPTSDIPNATLLSTRPGNSSQQQSKVVAISRQDLELIIRTLELCQKNMTHFSANERIYLMPLMTLSGHALLTETQLISRSYLSTVSEILVYILQFLLGEISMYSDEESNYLEFNPTFLQQMQDVPILLNYDSEDYYRYFVKYRLIKFLGLMLLDDEKKWMEDGLNYHDLIALCQMLRIKPLPDTLRLHKPSYETNDTPMKSPSNATSSPMTIPSGHSDIKRIRLTVPGPLERNSKEEFFDQLLTPFIFSNNSISAAAENISSNTPSRSVPITAAVSGVSSSYNETLFKPSLAISPNVNVVANTSAAAAAAVPTTKFQSNQQIRTYLISQNQMYFQYIGGATSILNLINNYTLLRPYVLHLLAIEEGANLRLIRLDSTNFDLICDRITADIDLVNSVFALNRLLEPLSCDRISKMIVIVQACLNACLTLIIHANQDVGPLSPVCSDSTELTKSEKSTLKIIEKSLLLYDRVFDIFRQSNRVAGQISQNAHMFTAWLLFSGLQMILNSKQSGQRQQGYSFLCIPLAKHALKLMSYLMDDLHLEFGDQNNILDESDDAHHQIQELNFFKKFSFNIPSHCSGQASVTTTPSPTPVELSPSSSRGSMPTSSTSTNVPTNINIRAINSTFKYNKFGHYSAWQRIDMIVSSNLNVIHLLFSYLSAGYRRATLLRHSSCKLPVDEHSSGTGNEPLFDDDEFSSWTRKFFEQQQNENIELKRITEMTNHIFDDFQDLYSTYNSKKQEQSSEADIKQHEMSDLKARLECDIDSHYELVISILDHLNYYYICTKIEALRLYFKQMLTDAQLIVLAHVIQDLDSEMDNVQALSPLSSKTFCRFSSSLTSLMHNLIAMQILSDEQQNSLLAYLGFKPSLESECSWPLHHGVRSLAILAQIILLRQQKEQEDIKLDLNSTTILIWRGFINKLKQAALTFKGETAFFNSECPDFQEDLNVEHAQLMLFLFHNLKLLQRKHVFSLVGSALNEISVKLNTDKCSVSAAQILFIGRILHLFEYMCKNLYDTPAYLFEQINHNLLISIMNREINHASTNSKEDLIKVELDELEKYPDSLRNIKFFIDKKLEMNFFNYLICNHKNASKKPKSPDMLNVNNLNLSCFDFIIHPRFYHLMDVSMPLPKSSSLRNFKPKLDGIACNFMLAGFSPLTYDQFYNSLLNLFQFLGYQYDFDSRVQEDDTAETVRYPQLGAFGLCTLDYTFDTMWRLLNQLPPSLQFLQEISMTVESSIENTQNFLSIDASRILNMCIWMPRFENNRPTCTWVADLLSKVGNNETPGAIETIITDLTKRFSSLEFNYHLLKCICWPFFRYSHSSPNGSTVYFGKNYLITQQQQLLPLKHCQFPKFFTLFTMEIYIDRLIYLFNDELKPSKSAKKSSDHIPPGQELIESYLNLLLGLFDKIYNEVNAILLYDGPLSQAGCNDSSDMNYLFYRSMVNIGSMNSFDNSQSNLSEICSNIIDYLPMSILSKIDQWNRLYVNIDRNIAETETPSLFQKCILFDPPLIELPHSNSSSNGSSKNSNYLYHFSAFINEKYAVTDTPNVNSVDTGYANITWTKLKQLMMKMYKFSEFIYAKRDLHLQNDAFAICSMLELNLISGSYVSKLSDGQNSLSFQVLKKFFDFNYDTYCFVLYPYFIGNSFFILTVFNHPLFSKLKEIEKTKFKKIFQISSLKFLKFFSKILKKPPGKGAFEEFFCEESPSTPTGQQQTSLVTQYSLLNLIEVVVHPLATPSYAVEIMELIKVLFSQSSKDPDDISLIRLCSGLSSALLERQDRVYLLSFWFSLVLFNRAEIAEDHPFFGSVVSKSNETKLYIDDTSNANLYLFFKFICYSIKETSRIDEIVLVSIAEAVTINAHNLITSTFIQSSNVFLYFSGLFTSLVYLMSVTGNTDEAILQSDGRPGGHFKLIHQVMEWLTICKDYMSKKNETSLNNGRHRFLMEFCYQMLAYLSDIFNALEYKFIYLKSRKDIPTSQEDSQSKAKDEKDKKDQYKKPNRIFIDDHQEDENEACINESEDEIEDEDDEDLANQLCTYTQTQKEFINQHWYHCHTCKLLEGVGVCTICAKVCHRDHDVTYSKYGSFFCDCGAKQDGSCKAMVKRPVTSTSESKKDKAKKRIVIKHSTSNATNIDETKKTIYDKKRSMRISKYWYTSFYSMDSHYSKLSDNYKASKNKFANQMIVQNYERFGLRFEHLDHYSQLLMSFIIPISETVLSLVEFFVPALENFFQNDSELGHLSTIRKEFNLLHSRTTSLPIEKCERMMVPVKAWQDAVFDNVQFSTEQSYHNSVRLTTLAVGRHMSMLVLGSRLTSSSPIQSVPPCLMAVAHDKNRLSIIQLDHLLGQVYNNSKKKLIPHKIATVSLPFTIMTLSHNPYNDELIAACSLKECHVLLLARNGAITRHYAIPTSLDANNHIIKSYWFPDSQTELAIVTLDFIKIYDLSLEDFETPTYHFVIPSRKIRDMTFYCYEGNGERTRFILILSTRGNIYAQELDPESKSTDPFYVTSILNIVNPETWPTNQTTLVGLSIYYSHLLRMLFVSFLNGASFCAPFDIRNICNQQITNLTSLDFCSTNGSSNSSSSTCQDSVPLQSDSSTPVSSSSTSQSSQTQPLCQWTEVLTHPGLVFALDINTNSTVCFMIKSQSILVQELKIKKKVINFVAVSTVPGTSITENNSSRITTLISLCEDGSFRFHRTAREHTDFWLKPHLHNLDEFPKSYKSTGGKTCISNQMTNGSPSSSSSSKNPRFAVDFFERCVLMNDIEFGGSDVLEVYNTQQIKNRLNSANMYIACTKPNGFSITVTQTGAFDHIMAGVRVNLGVCDPARSPTAIEIFGRTIWVAINRNRWFDIPFTRSEIEKLAETNTFNIRFAPSGDPNEVTIVDCIRVYGRVKDSIGLNTEDENIATASTSTVNPPASNANGESSISFDYIGRKFLSLSSRSSPSPTSNKSPIQKLRLLLYAPTITDDDFVSTLDSKYQTMFVVNRLIANSLDVLEALISFSRSTAEMNLDLPRQPATLIVTARELINSTEFKLKCDTALSIASKLLTISLSNRLDKSVCMLMAKLMLNRTQYDEHRGEIIFEDAIANLKQRAYDDINVFRYNLLLFRESVHEHPRNFIRFIGKYFTQCSDIYTSTIHFCNYLVDLFWRIYSQRPTNELLCSLIKVSQYSDLDSIVDSLVSILYSSTHVVLANTHESQYENQQKIISRISSLVIQMLSSPDPLISFSTKKTLVKILCSVSSGVHRHLEKQSKIVTCTRQTSSSNKSSGHRERRHSGRHSTSTEHSVRSNISASNSNASVSTTEPSSSVSIGHILRRHGGVRRNRPSINWLTSRQDSSQASGRSGEGSSLYGSGSGNRFPASLLERVTESILDNDFDPYSSLLSIEGEFPYLQDLMASLRREQALGQAYESIPGEDEEDEDDDEDEEDEDDDEDEDEDEEDLDMASISQPEGNSSSAPPPLFPMNSFSGNEANASSGSGSAGIAQQPTLEEVLDENVRVDDDDEENEDEDEDDDDFETMDEDEMMEIAIALSLQEQHGSEARVIDIEYDGVGEPLGQDGANIPLAQVNRTIEEMVDDFRSHRHRERAQEEQQANQEPASVLQVPSEVAVQQASQSEGQVSHYSIHSESDDDDEELYDDEIKLGDATMESIDAEEDHDDDFDFEEEMNSMEISQHSSDLGLVKTSKFISKSNEALATHIKRPIIGTSGIHLSYSQSTENSNEKTKEKSQKDAQKNRKRLRRYVASKFCLALLKQMNNSLEAIFKLNGVQSIPFLQSISILTDFNYFECDQKEFTSIFNQIIKKLFDHLLKPEESTGEFSNITESPIHTSGNEKVRKVITLYKDRVERKPENEVQVLTMRLFSVFLSYFKRFPALTWQTFLAKDLPINEVFRANLPVPHIQQTTSKSTQVTFDESSIKQGSSTSQSFVSSATSSSSKSNASSIHYSLLLVASQLIHSNSNLLDYCYAVLHHLLKNYWRQFNNCVESEDSDRIKSLTNVGHSIEYFSKKSLKFQPHLNFIPTDLRPFFNVLPEVISSSPINPNIGSNQTGAQDTSGVVVVNHVTNSSCNLLNSCTTINSLVFSNHVFDHYPELLTEMSLRIPYQLKKLISFLNQQGQVSSNKSEDGKDENSTNAKPSIHIDIGLPWIETLCEYMMLPSVTPYIRKQVRKLLLNLCGSKDRYRQVRDYYALKTNIRAIRRIIVMHFFDSNTSSSNLAFKLQDLGMTEEDLDDEEQLDELIRVIIGAFIQNDDKASLMMMSSDQHRLLNLPYAQLINLVDYLKACLDIASTRVNNWQRLCRREIRIVPFLFRISFLFGEGISSIILQLLSLALFTDSKNSNHKKPEENNLTNNLIMSSSTENKSGSEGGKTEKPSSNNHQSIICCYVFVVLDRHLLSHFIRFFLLESNSSQQRWATHNLLYMFFESLRPVQQEQFLSMFWQLWPSIACYGKRASQFVDLLGYFTLTLSKIQNEASSSSGSSRISDMEKLYADSAIGLLRYQNQKLIKHPNSNIYNSLQSLLELNGYYLETEPCLVCNNPEINFVAVKLSGIKMDSRFTTNTQIVKLIGAHTISKITVKISESKKSKMVKTLCIYYNNRFVQSVVELKNKNTIWHKAKRITLSPSQSEVKIEFTLPIVACNLMIEYSDFYETSHSSTETLQCPRCSSVVLANPGVCTNCGENVFQCHKCRAINYDEKDPFLCNSCGFCKYAKFDYVLTARYTASAVESIENEEDRSKAVQTINGLLDKADRLYKTIQSLRPILENLILASQDYHSALYSSETIDSSSSSTTSTSGVGAATAATVASSSSSLYVNRHIHQLSTRYSSDCRIHFDELSKIVQKILYTRKELVDYDNRQNNTRHNFEDIKRLLQEHQQDIVKNFGGSTTSLSSTSSSNLVEISASTSASFKKQYKQALAIDEYYHGFETKKKKLSNDEDLVVKFDFKSGRCYGCASASIEHCIILLKALVHNPRYKTILSSSNLFRELIDYNLRIGTPSFRNKVRSLLCLLIRDDPSRTEDFNKLLLEKISSVLQTRYMTSFDFGCIRHEMSLLASSFENEDNCWEQRLRCVMKSFLLSLHNKSPAVFEAITLPCLRIFYGLIIKPSVEQNNKKTETGKSNPQQSANTVEQLASVQSSSRSMSEKSLTQIPFDSLMVNVSVDLIQWLHAETKASFPAWQQRNLKVPRSISEQYTPDPAKAVQFEEFLQRKYFARWLHLHQTGRIRSLKSECFIVRIASSTWMQEVLFNPTSKALRMACRQLLMALFEKLSSKQRVLIDLFTSFLDDLCLVGGEIGLEFYDLYRSIVFSEFSASAKLANFAKNCHWRYYLTCCGLLQHLGKLISAEIDRLKQLEESTLSSDFSQGSSLRQLVELMQLFMRDERIRRVHKSSMVGFVLDGYLSLRKLIVQRTKMIEETQGALLELIELLTTGTKAETINFMKVCIESVKKCSLQDLRTPVFIFERLCSIIHPEEKDADEFFIALEKDPQQEDFLQGRMMGNPYTSKDSGMGPLMRDIKNKICQECELVSLLEDDSGLELLVNNKIISLDLPVKEVYKKIVCADFQASNQQQSGPIPVANLWSSERSLNAEIAIVDAITGSVFPINANLNPTGSSSAALGPTMKIVYRIRGLMGDATEEFIETLCSKEPIVKDDEKLFELANIMSQSSGLSVMLERLQAIQEINNQSRSLLFVLVKLFGYCVRVISNRRALIDPELNAIVSMLGIVRLFLKNLQSELITAPSAPGEPSYFEQLLTIMETLLAEASKEDSEWFDRFNQKTCGSSEDIQMLINAVSSPDSIICTTNPVSLINKILRVVTFLAMGHSEKMTTLINNFRPYFEFDDYDTGNLENPDNWYELFCSLVSAIECNHNGSRLKNRLIEEGFVSLAIDYLVRNAPPMKNFVLLNSDEWKEFTSRPALKYVLKMLTGMCRGHEPTQELITKEGVPIIHALEQVLSDSHMATLAENLMDALKENPSVEAKIEEIRLKTREEKKRIAMAVREKQLGELGMKANDKGQVMADSELLKKMEDELKEEKGLVCSICREGYSYQPQKVLAIYTFTKRCSVEEFEDRKPRKTIGYTTVTHFNIVHVECHMDAVRHARTRDEWQSASLHNANTRCNGLLPLWGPNVFESLFAHALSRHNSYLQDAVGQRDFAGTNSFLGTVHDLKLLLLRFANEKSFSEETGGGGAQSNLYLTPYLLHTALYVMNTTKVVERERSSFEENFMQQTSAKLLESCFQVESPFFYSTMVLLLHSQEFWQKNRLYFLRRLILCSIIRNLPSDSRNLSTIAQTELDYATIKPALMFFSLINLFYTIMFKSVQIKPDSDWSQSLVDYIRHNDQHLLEAADKMLDTFENDILPSASFDEFCDASDLLRGTDAISDPDQFFKDTIQLTN